MRKLRWSFQGKKLSFVKNKWLFYQSNECNLEKIRHNVKIMK